MGIPHYFRVITQAYPGIVGLTMPATDHIFFDFNGAIHQSAKRVLDQKRAQQDGVRLADLYDEGVEEETETEGQIMEAVETYVRGLAARVRPAKGIYIYMDGVAPHAKLMQQRKRRYLSMLRYKLLRTAPIWDTNAISPGTRFMIRLAAFLKRQFQKEPLLSGRVPTRYSFSDENGEAEHKIFAAMAAIPHDEKIMIHGLDADLIMLSLLSHRPGITLMREPQDGAEFQFLCVDRLRDGILKELSSRYHWPIASHAAEEDAGAFGRPACDAIESYIVWCFLLGNDFLPHMPTLHLQKNGLQKILAASQHQMLVNSANSEIDWDTMCGVLGELAGEETDVLMGLVAERTRRRCHAKTDEEKVDMYPLLDENRSDLMQDLSRPAVARGGLMWRSLYYKRLFHTRMHDSSVVLDACEQYMTGMEWTYRYYKRLARDSTWYYPYAYAPTMSDLANHMATARGSHRALVDHWKEHYKVPTFLPDYIQLLCILPPESCPLLPKQLRGVMTDPAHGCTHMYPRKYPILTFLKTRLWECTPVLPPLDIPLLQKSTQRLITHTEKLRPRAKATEAFSRGFHIGY